MALTCDLQLGKNQKVLNIESVLLKEGQVIIIWLLWVLFNFLTSISSFAAGLLTPAGQQETNESGGPAPKSRINLQIPNLCDFPQKHMF